MATRPHDLTDLYLAPVVLAVDARIEELGRMDKSGLAYEVALESDTPDFTRKMREGGSVGAGSSGSAESATSRHLSRPQLRCV